jgi:hypothetical protein
MRDAQITPGSRVLLMRSERTEFGRSVRERTVHGTDAIGAEQEHR